MKKKKEQYNESPKTLSDKDLNSKKGANGKIGGDSESSGGSREGNAGQEGERYGSFGNR